MKDCLMINPQDNVGIALRELQTGEMVTVGERTIVIKEPILKGHKFALKDIAENENVIRGAGFPQTALDGRDRRFEHRIPCSWV
ncbi:hypothetical protein DT075_12285 [Bacillus licheniformis]|nr:hypothetical protein DT075_12285 [Bacillus licheniformis]